MTPDARDADRRARMMYPVVRKMALNLARRLPSSVCSDDLLGAALVGVADAIGKRRDDDADFFAYAKVRARGEMQEELRRNDPLTRAQRQKVVAATEAENALRRTGDSVPPPAQLAKIARLTPDALELARSLRPVGHTKPVEALHDVLAAPANDLAEALDQRRRASAVRKAVRCLPARLRRTLDCFGDGLSLRALGEELGVSEGRVCQLRKQAVERVRKHVASPAA